MIYITINKTGTFFKVCTWYSSKEAGADDVMIAEELHPISSIKSVVHNTDKDYVYIEFSNKYYHLKTENTQDQAPEAIVVYKINNTVITSVSHIFSLIETTLSV